MPSSYLLSRIYQVSFTGRRLGTTISHLEIFQIYTNTLVFSYLKSAVSSNINEIIKAVLKSFFFYEHILHTLKALKALKALNGTKTLEQKHKNANKRIGDYFSLQMFFRSIFYFYSLVSVLCLFVVVKFLNKEV